jgi:hypothetical protein
VLWAIRRARRHPTSATRERSSRSDGGAGTSLGHVAYTSAEARQELLDSLASAIDQIGFGLAALGAAYEQLDEYNADRLEAELFGPVQVAYGRAKGVYAQFAGR